MLSLKPCKHNLHSPFLLNQIPKVHKQAQLLNQVRNVAGGKTLVVRGSQGEENKREKRSFLTLEEAGLVEMSGLSSHEQFLCRLTISSLNLLRVISEQEGYPIEELNAGRICDWFVKDKLKSEQNIEPPVLQWGDSGFPM